MNLHGAKVLIIIAEGYHEHEFWFPYYRFREAGATVYVAAPKKGIVRGEGRNGKDGLDVEVEYTLEEAKALDYGGIFLPGGIFCPLELRNNDIAKELIRAADKQGRWIAAICHAPWVLISAGIVKGRHVACPSDMADDLENAGGFYVPDGAVQDGQLYTAVYFRFLPELFRLLLA